MGFYMRCIIIVLCYIITIVTLYLTTKKRIITPQISGFILRDIFKQTYSSKITGYVFELLHNLFSYFFALIIFVLGLKTVISGYTIIAHLFLIFFICLFLVSYFQKTYGVNERVEKECRKHLYCNYLGTSISFIIIFIFTILSNHIKYSLF